jgi:hypothetical protein
MKLICTKHPTYTGKRKPTIDCCACKDLWRLLKSQVKTTYFAEYCDGTKLRLVIK